MKPSIHEVKGRHAKRLLAMPGVVSVGIGKGAGGDPVLVIGLEDPRPETREALPEELEGYPVQTRVVGPFRAR